MTTVLIVDDDRNICKLLDFSLSRAGFSVLIANAGDDGYELATSHAPDVLVLDVMMPGMHGYELCRQLRKHEATAHAKILFLTARSQPIDEKAALKAGADLFLSKPVMSDELVKHIQALLVETAPLAPVQEETLEPEPEPEPEKALETPPQKPAAPAQTKGRLIACYSPTPGTGVTTLATNLALALAAWQRIQIPLVELHDSQGSLLPLIGRDPDPHRGNLRATGKTLNWDTLLLHLVEHPTGVRILPAPPPNTDVPAELTEQAVSLLRERFPVTVADAAPTMNDRVQGQLLAADLILLLTTPDVPAIRAMLQSLQALQKLNYPNRQILLVVNNVRPKATVPVEKLQEGIKRPVFAVIPYEPEMVEASHTGKPLLVTNPRAPASQAVGRMTMQLSRGLRLPQGNR